MDRIILHCDLNSFFASVELLSRPELRSMPVAVCGDPNARHGIILAKNEPAKAFGVQTAETIWQARRKCPDLYLLPPHHDQYRLYSRAVNDIYARYTDLVEPFGIDESWLDITGSAHLFGGDPKAIADDIRRTVREELGLTLSVGVSFNKVFAKLGSDYRKPDATTVISRQNWREIVWPLPVGSLLFAGRASQGTLKQYGVETIGQLAACQPEMLESLLGKNGLQLLSYARGEDQEAVRSRFQQEPVKSVGNGQTFPRDLTSHREVREELTLLADSVASRLRTCDLYAGGVQITYRTPDFRDFSRQAQLPAPTHLTRSLAEKCMELLERIWKPPAPIRMLTVTAIHLTEEGDAWQQEDLFTPVPQQEKQQKQEKLEQAMDSIRGKYGKTAIRFGASHISKEEDPLP